MDTLLPLAKRVGEKLKARKETVGISESSAGGLVSAALLAVPGASAYFMGGAVVYTRPAGDAFLAVPREKRAGVRSSSEPWALLAAEHVRERLKTTWG
ncbi:MAG: CinA family protein, partial [Reyranella sp.]